MAFTHLRPRVMTRLTLRSGPQSSCPPVLDPARCHAGKNEVRLALATALVVAQGCCLSGLAPRGRLLADALG
jgi:hypothetical protein